MRTRETATFHPKRRTAAVAVLMAVVLFLYGVRLFHIQIGNPELYAEQGSHSSQIRLPIEPTRGEILDRHMNELVVNTTTYTILLDRLYWPSGSSEAAHQQQAIAILRLTDLLTRAGETWNDVLPITKTSPYAFLEGEEDEVARLKESLRLASYATADNCMQALAEAYHLTELTPERVRTIGGVQYSIARSDFSNRTPYEFSPSVSKKTSYQINEMASLLPGVNVVLTPDRAYVAGDLASHLIGTVGLLSAEEYAALKDKGYSYNDVIGKFGIEQVMESALRGVKGERTVIKNADGVVTEEAVSVNPTPGDTVVLTLDADLQRTAQKTMNDIITEFRAQKKGAAGQDIGSGGAVILDIRDGGVLTCASWPNFTLSSYYTDYAALASHPDNPLFNRALDGAFAPGSTFKVSVALAAMAENVLGVSSRLPCNGVYSYYASSGLTIRCMGYHGNITIPTALGKSCNAFFCEAGRLTGIQTMNRYATLLGLGVKTGIEVGESAGTLAGPAAREAAGGVWYPADTSQAALGQSDNLFTPMQLAAYAMTLANRGVRYETHLVRSTIGYDGTVTEVAPKVAATVEGVSPAVWDTIHEGMELTFTNGTATRFFYGVDYEVAAKTGTAEAGNGGSDHGVFIGYAPADDPEIAIAVVMENGTSAAACRTARTLLDRYFARQKTDVGAVDPGEMLS